VLAPEHKPENAEFAEKNRDFVPTPKSSLAQMGWNLAVSRWAATGDIDVV
jgi:hypothetical protein